MSQSSIFIRIICYFSITDSTIATPHSKNYRAFTWKIRQCYINSVKRREENANAGRWQSSSNGPNVIYDMLGFEKWQMVQTVMIGWDTEGTKDTQIMSSKLSQKRPHSSVAFGGAFWMGQTWVSLKNADFVCKKLNIVNSPRKVPDTLIQLSHVYHEFHGGDDCVI